jgi:hypothetical protein
MGFLSEKWLDMNEEVAHMISSCTNKKILVGVGSDYLEKAKYKW